MEHLISYLKGMIVGNNAHFLIRINVFEGKWIQGVEYKPKCLDGMHDVEDDVTEGRSQLKEKMAFHLLEVVTVLEDRRRFRQKIQWW